MHAPKVSYYDLQAKTHTVSSGPYPVDRYEQRDGWLYLARPFVGHPHIASMEAYLLPALGLQVNRWGHHPGSEYAWYDFYVDVMAFEVGETCWTSRDLYLDVVVVESRAAYVVDTGRIFAGPGRRSLNRRRSRGCADDGAQAAQRFRRVWVQFASVA